MTDVSHISKIVLPLIEPFQQQSVLVAGEQASLMCSELPFVQAQFTSRFQQQQLMTLNKVELTIVTDLTETLAKTEAMQWLGVLKNKLSQHVILILDIEKARENTWQLTDFLGLGFKLYQQVDGYQIFYYAIESYQIKKDWLNAKHWANPENFNKYRW